MAGKDLSLGITLLTNERLTSLRAPGGWGRIVDDSVARILQVIRVELHEIFLAEQGGPENGYALRKKTGGSN